MATIFKPFTVWVTTNCRKSLKKWEYQTTWPASWEICMQVKKQQPELNIQQQTGFKLGKEYIKAVYCHPAYLTYMQSAVCLVTPSRPTLCDPVDCSPPGSSVHGILQARILEWVVISFSSGSSQPRDRTWVSRISGGFFTVWATRDASYAKYIMQNPRLDEAQAGTKVSKRNINKLRYTNKPL